MAPSPSFVWSVLSENSIRRLVAHETLDPDASLQLLENRPQRVGAKNAPQDGR